MFMLKDVESLARSLLADLESQPAEQSAVGFFGAVLWPRAAMLAELLA